MYSIHDGDETHIPYYHATIRSSCGMGVLRHGRCAICDLFFLLKELIIPFLSVLRMGRVTPQLCSCGPAALVSPRDVGVSHYDKLCEKEKKKEEGGRKSIGGGC